MNFEECPQSLFLSSMGKSLWIFPFLGQFIALRPSTKENKSTQKIGSNEENRKFFSFRLRQKEFFYLKFSNLLLNCTLTIGAKDRKEEKWQNYKRPDIQRSQIMKSTMGINSHCNRMVWNQGRILILRGHCFALRIDNISVVGFRWATMFINKSLSSQPVTLSNTN